MSPLPWTRGAPKPVPASIPIPGRERGTHCPNCDYPIYENQQAAANTTPSVAGWTCSHCGWSMSAPQFGRDDLTPRPGKP